MYAPFLKSKSVKPGKSYDRTNAMAKEMVDRFNAIIPGCRFMNIEEVPTNVWARAVSDSEDGSGVEASDRSGESTGGWTQYQHYRARSVIDQFAANGGELHEFGCHPSYKTYEDSVNPEPVSLPIPDLSTSMDIFANPQAVVGVWDSLDNHFDFMKSPKWKKTVKIIKSVGEFYL